MKKYKIYLVALFLLVIASFCFITFKYRKNKLTQITDTAPSYFKPAIVEKFSSSQLPYILVQLEDKEILSVLDLGFEGGFSISPNATERIKEKKFIRQKTMYGMKGKEYHENIYSIPNIEIGDSTFSNIYIQDGNTEEFDKGSVIIGNNEGSFDLEEGRIGWKLFQNSNLFLDLKNSKIAFCDSIETLRNQGYFLGSFAKTPLLLERSLVEIDVTTYNGTMRCVLDTGATWNILNRPVEEPNPEKIEEFPLFQIGELDFSPISFHPLSIKLPIHIEAMLGMEFFFDHVVFLDFKSLQAYFYKSRG